MSPKCVYIVYRFDEYLKRRGNLLSLFVSLPLFVMRFFFTFWTVIIYYMPMFLLLVFAAAIYHFDVVHVKLNNYMLFIHSGKLMSTLISMDMGYFDRVRNIYGYLWYIRHIRARQSLHRHIIEYFICFFFFLALPCHVFDVIILLAV